MLITAAASKIPYFVLGGLLVVWAVALGWFGLKRPGWPDQRGARGVMAATAILAALTVAADIYIG
ncbi:MAG: hypothetical protein ACRDMX_09565 [Solirubrobacteraceae bacterium]